MRTLPAFALLPSLSRAASAASALNVSLVVHATGLSGAADIANPGTNRL